MTKNRIEDRDQIRVDDCIDDVDRALSADMALFGSTSLRPSRAKRYAAIGDAWELVIPFFAFPTGIRKMIYTTDAVERWTAACARS
jgi:transposase-like protein